MINVDYLEIFRVIMPNVDYLEIFRAIRPNVGFLLLLILILELLRFGGVKNPKRVGEGGGHGRTPRLLRSEGVKD